jgi:hypothetical protein
MESCHAASDARGGTPTDQALAAVAEYGRVGRRERDLGAETIATAVEGVTMLAVLVAVFT